MIELSRTSPLPYYRQIEDWYRAEIGDGRLQPHALLPDERVLARKLKLSRMTVRRAIVALTDEGLLYRIRGRGTYVAEAKAKPALNSGTAQVQVIAPFGQAELRQSFFYYRILEGLQSATIEHHLTLAHRRPAPPYSDLIAALSGGRVDALIVLGIVDRDILRACAAAKLPLLLIDSAQPEGAHVYDSVSLTGEESSHQAVLHLLELGHRRISMLSFGPTPAALEREAGFTRAMAGRGLAATPEVVLRIECNASAAYAATRRMLRETADDVTALFCGTDELALGAINAVKDHGLRVPQDISIVGFGDLGYFSQPALSSVRIPLEEMGRKSAEVLRARLDRADAPPVRIVFPSEFVARASSDLPRDV